MLSWRGCCKSTVVGELGDEFSCDLTRSLEKRMGGRNPGETAAL
jgi:hypothetical protein